MALQYMERRASESMLLRRSGRFWLIVWSKFWSQLNFRQNHYMFNALGNLLCNQKIVQMQYARILCNDYILLAPLIG